MTLPFERARLVPYERFVLRLPPRAAARGEGDGGGWRAVEGLRETLRAVPRARIRAMQAAMEGVWRNFTYPLNAYPALVAAAPDVPLVVETGNGAMDLILRELELRARDRGR